MISEFSEMIEGGVCMSAGEHLLMVRVDPMFLDEDRGVAFHTT